MYLFSLDEVCELRAFSLASFADSWKVQFHLPSKLENHVNHNWKTDPRKTQL